MKVANKNGLMFDLSPMGPGWFILLAPFGADDDLRGPEDWPTDEQCSEAAGVRLASTDGGADDKERLGIYLQVIA